MAHNNPSPHTAPESGSNLVWLVAVGAAFVIGYVVGDMKPAQVKATDSAKKAAAATDTAKPAAPSAAPSQPPSADPVFNVPMAEAYVKGPKDALVTIVEFSDFQCPFCSRVVPTIKELTQTYGDKLRIGFRHQPLSFHPNALPAAKAAEAAGRQGKFWEMHDKLFENQRELTEENYVKWAGELGLNTDKFKADYAAPETEKKIKDDQVFANSIGASGTPAFFINGKKLSGAQPVAKFKEVIDRELKAAEAKVKGGTPLAALYNEIIKDGLRKPPEQPKQQQQPQRRDTTTVNYVEHGTSPAKGAKGDALVNIVVFSEFQCPFCNRIKPTLDEVLKTYGDKVKMTFRHFPLGFHQNAHIASQAALAAQAQGKFWEMHDKLFENQKALGRDDLVKYAGEIGLNVAQFTKDLDSGKFKQAVDDDQKYGNTVGVRGTPATFINGELLSGAQPFPAFKGKIDREIEEGEKLLKEGKKLGEVYKLRVAALKSVADKEAAEANKPKDIKAGDAPSKGPANAPVTIVEFSDFQCPYCSRVVPALKAVEEKYGNKVRIAFRHQPLPFHDKAKLAAEASMAAHAQGKFWAYHDKLFENQKALAREDLIKYAGEVGLNVDQFTKDIDSGKFTAYVNADQAYANSVGANGTPTSFINGREVSGAQPKEAFFAIIDEELAKNKN